MSDITKPFRNELRKILDDESAMKLTCAERMVGRDYLDAWDHWAALVEKQTTRRMPMPLIVLTFPVYMFFEFRGMKKIDKLYVELEAKQKRWNDLAVNKRKARDNVASH